MTENYIVSMNRPKINELLEIIISSSIDTISNQSSLITKLAKISLHNRLEVRLFGNNMQVLQNIVADRIVPFVKMVKPFSELVYDLNIKTLKCTELWSFYLPIAQYLIKKHTNMNSCYITGVIGGPGAGKTTFAKLLTHIMKTGYHLLAVDISSDDFYISRSERISLGFKWRGLPETHETELVRNAFENLKKLRQIQRLPRYDLELDDRSRFETIKDSLCFCFFEGWMVAKLIEDVFGSINNIIDYLIFLDAKIDFLKKSMVIF